MTKKLSVFVEISLLAALLAPIGRAQVGTQGVILGVLADQNGLGIPDATVAVRSVNTGFAKSVQTDAQGYFEIPALSIGTYEISVVKAGFNEWKQTAELTIGDRKRLTPVLYAADVKQSVTVQSTAESIQTESVELGGTITAHEMTDLPLLGRNPLQLIGTVPGMQFVTLDNSSERATYVQGVGMRQNQTEFQLDGLNVNAGMNEGGTVIPHVDAIAEMKVETFNFSAEHGRNPLQVILVTKGGTNQLHGGLWEYHRNSSLDARNTFSGQPPRDIRNQFGGSISGPLIRNRTMYYATVEGIRERGQTVYNSVTPDAAMLNGNFGTTQITDPGTGLPFPNNTIPQDRFSPASSFLKQFFLKANSGATRFRTTAPNDSNGWNGLGRIDHNFGEKHRVYVHYANYQQGTLSPGYTPSLITDDYTVQHHFGGTYNYTISPRALLTADMGYLSSDNRSGISGLEQRNYTDQAGIQGFPSNIVGKWAGIPTVAVTGNTGFTEGTMVPGRLWSNVWNGKTALSLMGRRHTTHFGWEYNDRAVYGEHGSSYVRGQFSFTGMYTGNPVADYDLGLVASAARNQPLRHFGLIHAPYQAAYVQDYWNVNRRITLSLGFRFDLWGHKQSQCGNAATWSPSLNKIVADVDTNGKINLTCQDVAPFLAAATKELWVSAPEAGVPVGLAERAPVFAPRIGITWRLSNKTVARAGYGLFASSFEGNRSASSIAGPPFWSYETISFVAASKQRWETVFSSDPSKFTAPSVIAPASDLRAQKIHQWNIAIEQQLPAKVVFTIAYQGNQSVSPISGINYNAVPPGKYANLQAARPQPIMGTITRYENVGNSWYNALSVSAAKRYSNGLLFNLAYIFQKYMLDGTGQSTIQVVQPFTPKGYQRWAIGYPQMLTVSGVYAVPVGRNRAHWQQMNRFLDGIIGGWRVSSFVTARTGGSLTAVMGSSTLGNGLTTRPDQIGDWHVANADASQWFNQTAFAAPATYAYGTTPMRSVIGPGAITFNTGLMKDFTVTERINSQLRWEMFNALNHTNLGSPGMTFATSTFGRITSSAAARVMQIALKVTF